MPPPTPLFMHHQKEYLTQNFFIFRKFSRLLFKKFHPPSAKTHKTSIRFTLPAAELSQASFGFKPARNAIPSHPKHAFFQPTPEKQPHGNLNPRTAERNSLSSRSTRATDGIHAPVAPITARTRL